MLKQIYHHINENKQNTATQKEKRNKQQKQRENVSVEFYSEQMRTRVASLKKFTYLFLHS